MSGRIFSDISYEQYLQEEKLTGSRCRACGTLFVPPHSVCTQCYEDQMEWVELTGRGKLSAFTCIAVGPPRMMAEGYDRKNPYCSGVVHLEEGAGVVARIVGVDARRPETIGIGMPLEVQFLHRGEGEASQTFLAFRPSVSEDNR